jgi:hypothetical protein
VGESGAKKIQPPFSCIVHIKSVEWGPTPQKYRIRDHKKSVKGHSIICEVTWNHFYPCTADPPITLDAVTSTGKGRRIDLLDLPPEILLLILEKLLLVDPITLLGSVPGVCKRLRALCKGVRGRFDLTGWEDRGWLERPSSPVRKAVVKGVLASAARLFLRTTGLWTFGVYPLHFASETGLAAAASRLLDEAPVKVNQAIITGTTPLFVACQNCHLDVVRLLVEKGAEVDKATNSGATPLLMACAHCHLDIVRLLLDKGADVNKATNDSSTPLWIACCHGDLDVVRLLIDKGAEVDKARDNGTTPLIKACLNRHLDVARLLIDKGAEVDKATNSGATPLLVACNRGHLDVARLLLENGAVWWW